MRKILCKIFPLKIYLGIPFKIDRGPPSEKFTKEFPSILIWVYFTKESPGKYFFYGNPL